MSEQNASFPHVIIGLQELNANEIKGVNNLLRQLSRSSSASVIDEDIVAKMLNQPNFRLIILKNWHSGEVIGMASLYYYKSFNVTGGIGRVEDVVVDQKYRGRGLGEMIIKFTIRLAKTLTLKELELTSNPKRIEANKLYLKMGFQKYDTNYYVMDL